MLTLTLQLITQIGDLGIGIVNNLVHLCAQRRVFVRETSGQKLLVYTRMCQQAAGLLLL